MFFNKKIVKDVEIKNKRVLVRCDFNVPLDKNGNIEDNRRIVAALPTIQYLIDNGNKVILCSHLGRPDGEWKKELSLMPVKKELEKRLGIKVRFPGEIVGKKVEKEIAEMKDGEVLLLENLRFDKRETKNDESLSKELASLAEYFVNDAFGTAHRAHCSTAGVAEILPAVGGFLMEKEINYLGAAIKDPERPFVAILAGKKVSDKISVINKLLEQVDTLIIAGGMANAFFVAMGESVGKSIYDDESVQTAKEILKKVIKEKKRLILPIDVIVAKDIDDVNTKEVMYTNIPEDMAVYDIGKKSVENFKREINKAKTVFWNGPVGVFEKKQFEKGTKEIAKILADLNGITIVGGGDTASAIEKFKLDKKISHISTGGGASLEFIEGKELPGIALLQNK